MLRTRRQLIAGVAAAFAAGGIAAGAGYWMLRSEDRELSVIGARDSQVWMLDTGSARGLFMLGGYDSALIEALPSLVHIDRKRIDLLVASSAFLQELPMDLAREYRIAQVMSVQMDGSAPAPLSGAVLLNGSREVELGGMRIALKALGPTSRPDATDNDMDPDWIASLEWDGNLATLISSEAGLRSADLQSPVMIAVPSIERTLEIELPQQTLLVSNQRPDENVGGRFVLPAQDEPVAFRLTEHGVSIAEGYVS